MRKRIFAVLALVVTLSVLGVTIFAQEPNIKSPAVEYLGYYQNAPQDDGTPNYWGEMACPTCGAMGYTITLSDTPVLNNGDIIAIITDTEATRNESYYEMGIINDAYTEHTTASHINGMLFTWSVSGGEVVFTTMPKSTNIADFVWLICPTTAIGYADTYTDVYNDVVGNINNYVRGYASAFVVQPLYSDALVDAIISDSRTEAYADGYADGQINAQRNMEAIDYIGEVIDGVSFPIMDAMSKISFFGISLLSLAGLSITVTLIMFIIKIVRG